MDLEHQRQLEKGRRLVPIFATLGLACFGCTMFVIATRHEMLISLLTVGICGMAGILALGVLSIRLRRVMLSHEERIQELESHLRRLKEDNAVK